MLSPALSDYRKRVFYVTHDVSSALGAGRERNRGRARERAVLTRRACANPKTETFGAPRLLLQLHIEYDDGSSEDVVSDESWKLSADGPIVANNEYDGEQYDARKEFADWARPGFRDGSWLHAQLVDGARRRRCPPP